MKKLLLLLAVPFILLACEGPEGPPGPGTWDVYDVEINPGDWIRDNSRSFFYFPFQDDYLSSVIYNDGIVLAYLEMDGKYQTLLPYTRYFEGWSELMDFEFYTGGITFFSTPSDFDTRDRPARAVIRIVYLW